MGGAELRLRFIGMELSLVRGGVAWMILFFEYFLEFFLNFF